MVGPTFIDSILFTVWVIFLHCCIAVPIWWVWWRDPPR